MLVIAENAALEFAGYGHGDPLVSCAAANEDWYYGHPPYQYSGERALVAGCAMAVNDARGELPNDLCVLPIRTEKLETIPALKRGAQKSRRRS